MQKLWEIELTPPKKMRLYLKAMWLFFMALIYSVFWQTEEWHWITIVYFLLSLKFICLDHQLQTHRGWIAFFVEEALFYAKKQRFELTRAPFLMPDFVILSLRSKTDRQPAIYVLCADQMSLKAWRELHCILQKWRVPVQKWNFNHFHVDE